MHEVENAVTSATGDVYASFNCKIARIGGEWSHCNGAAVAAEAGTNAEMVRIDRAVALPTAATRHMYRGVLGR